MQTEEQQQEQQPQQQREPRRNPLTAGERARAERDLRSDAPDSAYQVLQGLCLATDNCI